MKIKIILIIAITISYKLVFCQDVDKTINITVSGSGKSLEEAKLSAFRSAINQAVGSFINSNSENLYDELTLEPTKIFSNGYIKSFSILNQAKLPDNNFGITLKTTVSLNKLITQAESKGFLVEFKGGNFASNIRQQLLNEQSEIRAVNELVGLLHEPMQISFNYKVKVNNPQALDSESKNWKIPITVTATTNNNLGICISYFIKTLSTLSLTTDEVKNYQSLNKNIYTLIVNYNGISNKIYLRKQMSLTILNAFVEQWKFYNKLFFLQCGQEVILADFKNSNLEISNYNTEILTINYPSVGKQSGIFFFEDKKTLNEIENMSDYKVTPVGVISKFKYGGIVVYENNGHGLICSISDFGIMEWDLAKSFCEDLKLNYYTDWRLPTKDELKYIYNDLYKNEIGGFKSDIYWSSQETYDKLGAYFKNFSNSDFNHTSKTKKNKVLAVRSF